MPPPGRSAAPLVLMMGRVAAWIAIRLADAFEAERTRLVLWPPVFMIMGVLLYDGLKAEPPPWIGAKFAIAAFAAALVRGARAPVRLLSIAAGFAALGFAVAQHETARAPPIETDLPFHAVLLSGTVHALEILPGGRRVTLDQAVLGPDPKPASHGAVDPSWRTLTRMVRITLKASDLTRIETGDRISVRAMLRPPPLPAFPGAWDTQFVAFHTGVGAYGSALGRIDHVETRTPDGPGARLRAWREAIAARVAAAIPGAPGAVAVTLLTGLSTSIPEADHAAFRDSGLAHLLAVAGLHIGIVMACGLGLARSLMALSVRASLFWPTKPIAAVFALTMGGFYLVLTGAHVPIVRSFAMACLATLAVICGRRPLSPRGLSLAAMVLITLSPHEVPGVSFQMSFSAVLALIAGYEALRPWLRTQRKGRGRWLRSHLIALVLTSTLAGTASLPYGAYHFGHVQTYYILSNMIAVPVTAVWIMPAGLLGLALMPFGLEALALTPMGWGTALVIGIARVTAALPGAQAAVPHIPAWGLAVVSLGLVWLGLSRIRLRLLGVPAILVGLLSFLWDRPPDILVSADAGLIGFRTPGGVYFQQAGGASAFVREAWLNRWSAPAARPVPMGEGVAAEGALTCGRAACVFQPDESGPKALLVRGTARPEACGPAAIVVSAEPARWACGRTVPALVDRFTVWRDGPTAIWLTRTGVQVLTDRANRGDRPWVSPAPKPRPPPAPALPLAPLDEGTPVNSGAAG